MSALILYTGVEPCDRGEFGCETGEQCIPDNQICNGDEDCADGSDEIGCPGEMIEFTFESV